MEQKKLTDEGVAKLKAPTDQQFQNHFDKHVPGLVLRVSAKGRKTWVAQYYTRSTRKEDGKPITIVTSKSLGLYPILKVKEARDKARLFLADPKKALSEAKALAEEKMRVEEKALAEAKARGPSFKEVAENFVKRHVETKGLRTKADIERLLAKCVYPKWGDKPFRDIKRSEVADLLDQIQDKHGARQADVVLAIIRKTMNWYTTRNDDYTSPVARGMHRSNSTDHKRKRILNYDEIKALWTACDSMTDKTVFGAMVRVLLLTAQRREKVATMQWANLANGVWTIPTEAREKSNAGSLTLPQVVQDIIAAQPRLEDNPHVFPGRTPGRRRKSTDKTPPAPPAFNSFSKAKEAFDLLMLNELQKIAEARNDSAKLIFVAKVRTLLEANAAAKGREAKKELTRQLKQEWWTLHDLRRTAKSLMAKAGVLPHVSERVLGHSIKGVEGVYDRHSYDAEKADALQRLADLVDRIVNPPEDNVIALRR